MERRHRTHDEFNAEGGVTMALLETIKKAGLGAVDASNPVVVRFGTVTKTNPLEINVEQRMTLSQNFLVVAERLTEYKVTINGETVVIRRGLQVGDKVVLLRVQGGGKYVVLDRVV